MAFQVVPGNEPLPRPGLYVIEHAESGKRYVGISVNVKRRLYQHANTPTGDAKLARAVKKHGASAFIARPAFYLLPGQVPDEFLEAVEAEFIASCSSTTNGYNVLDASSGIGSRRTLFADPEFRKKEIARLQVAASTPKALAKRGAALRRNYDEHPERRAQLAALAKARFTGQGNPNFGRPMPEETKAKLSASRTGLTAGEKHHMFGKHQSDETKRKISEARKKSDKGRGSDHYSYGKKVSPERLAQMSAHMKGKWCGDDNPMRKEHNKRTCEHCGMRMAVNTYARFHGDNCKRSKVLPLWH